MANLTCNDTVEQRLQTFQDIRLPRCATTQIMSNAMFYSQALDKVDLIRKFYQGPLPPADQHSWSEPLRDFFYAYDVYVECEKAMQHRDKEGRVPEGVLKYFGSL
jgi:salicylate hydroxylase